MCGTGVSPAVCQPECFRRLQQYVPDCSDSWVRGALYEMIHEARIIPLDGRPHPPQNVRQWNGDSRGRWDGNTLIVDTTNYNGKGWIATSAATGRIKGIPQSEALHVVERFTRVNPDTIQYEVTIEDPEVHTRPGKWLFPSSGMRIIRSSSTPATRAIMPLRTSLVEVAPWTRQPKKPRRRD